MRYDVEIAKNAKQDLYDIYRYISEILLVPETALKQINRLEESIVSLDSMPERFPVYDMKQWKELRFISVDNYMIFYSVDSKNYIVNITRIMYGRRNIEEHLEK